MKNTLLIASMDIKESFRSKWFLVYVALFSAIIALFFVSGVIDSRVSGFSGLSRVLLLYIQICFIIMPIFILITTVRSIGYERDMNTLEYLLSFPIKLSEYYFGKAIGRAFIVVMPVFSSILLSIILALIKSVQIPWDIVFLYSALLCVLCFFFLCLGFLISATIKTQELALALAFFIWLFLLAFLDLALIGLMMRSAVNEHIIYSIALLNPIEIFRIASMSLFDPNLTVIAPAAYFILDSFGKNLFILYSIFYPIFMGFIALFGGYGVFSRKDLL